MEQAGKDNRVLLVVVIIAVLAVIVIWNTGKKADPVNFDTDPFAEENQPTPVDIDHRQQELMPVAVPAEEDLIVEEGVDDLMLPEEGVDPDAIGETAIAPAPTAAPTYTVRSGDYLAKIAANQLGNSRKWKEIFELNRALLNDDPKRLKVGMKLVLPAGAKPVPVVDNDPVVEAELEAAIGGEAKNAEATTTISYTVKKGDSLYKIASKIYGNGLKWPKIAEANRKILGPKNRLAIGQVLVVPPVKGAAPTQEIADPELITGDAQSEGTAVKPAQPKTVNESGIDESIFNFEQKVQVP